MPLARHRAGVQDRTLEVTLAQIESELKVAIDEYTRQDVNDRAACARKRERVSDLIAKRAAARQKTHGTTRA